MLIKLGASFAGIVILGTSLGLSEVFSNVTCFSPSISVVPNTINVGVIGLPSLSINGFPSYLLIQLHYLM